MANGLYHVAGACLALGADHALAFEGFVPPYEATMVTNLREAGAIILAKTVMTELANFMANGMPGNYSAVGDFGLNPYDPRRDPREGRNDGRPVMGTGGSSSGIGTATKLSLPPLA